LKLLELSLQLRLCSHFFAQLFFQQIFVLKLKLEQQVQLLQQLELEQLEMMMLLELKLEQQMLEEQVQVQQLALVLDQTRSLFQLNIHQLQLIACDVQSSLFRNLILL